MAHRTPKINDTVKFTDQQQAILNDAVEQLMEAGGLTALTQAHFNEAMKIVAQRFINAALQGELKHHLTQEDENLNEEESSAERVENKRNGYSKKTLQHCALRHRRSPCRKGAQDSCRRPRAAQAR